MASLKPAYIFSPSTSTYHYGFNHPMEPYRVNYTHSLIHTLGLDKHMDIFNGSSTLIDDNSIFEWRKMFYNSPKVFDDEGSIYNDDSIYFPGVKEYTMQYSSTSILAARLLLIDDSPLNKFYEVSTPDKLVPIRTNHEDPYLNKILQRRELKERYIGSEVKYNYAINNKPSYDVIINWAGGLHHGRKNNFAGFCYFNDIVQHIQILLTKFSTVLYIDIDVHHGDGVEEAFRFNPRVHTFSVHKFGGGFFPGTGSLYSNTPSTTNLPLLDGADDSTFEYTYYKIIDRLMEKVNPSVVVVQCGGDSIAEDPIGKFNLSIEGHGKMIKYIKDRYMEGRKLVLLGGGGYTPVNVARLWAYESILMCEDTYKFNREQKIKAEFFPEKEEVLVKDLMKIGDNKNKREYLDNVLSYVMKSIDK